MMFLNRNSVIKSCVFASALTLVGCGGSGPEVVSLEKSILKVDQDSCKFSSTFADCDVYNISDRELKFSVFKPLHAFYFDEGGVNNGTYTAIIKPIPQNGKVRVRFIDSAVNFDELKTIYLSTLKGVGLKELEEIRGSQKS